MVKQQNGHIINIASALASKAVPLQGVYSAAKAGILMMSRVLAVELAQYNIRVNVISPGLTRTAMTQYAWSNPESLKQKESTIAIGRIGEPVDIGGAAVFLASDAASYVTGHNLQVEGGLLA